MKLQVDQSGRVEFTSQDTVIAFANGISQSVRIPKKVKRKVQKALRERGIQGKGFTLRIFSIGLYFLLRDYLGNGKIVIIDEEYEGHAKNIKSQLINLLRRNNYQVASHQIRFARIGKSSPAHTIAINTLRKKISPDLELSEADIFGELRTNK